MKFKSTVFLGGKTATGIPIPAEVVASFGTGKRYPVVATINGHSYRTTVVVYSGEFMIPLAAENREAAGVSAGQEIEVDLVLDTAPREVEVPEDLTAAFSSSPAARAFFDSLSYTHRKEYVRWIEEAKKPETRASRVEKTVALLAEGKPQR
jgi:hypothetical protein